MRKVFSAFAELIESAMYLYRATGDPILLELGRDAVESIEKISKVECGFATVSVFHRSHSGKVSFSAARASVRVGFWEFWHFSHGEDLRVRYCVLIKQIGRLRNKEANCLDKGHIASGGGARIIPWVLTPCLWHSPCIRGSLSE